MPNKLFFRVNVRNERNFVIWLTSGVNFINILRTNFSNERWFGSFSLVTFLVSFLLLQKICTKNTVNFINILHTCFFIQKCVFCQNVTREKLRKALLYKKHVCKMLMKLTPGIEYSLSCREILSIQALSLTIKENENTSFLLPCVPEILTQL